MPTRTSERKTQVVRYQEENDNNYNIQEKNRLIISGDDKDMHGKSSNNKT